jgi:DNA-binding NarL/FixJ family response regulator
MLQTQTSYTASPQTPPQKQLQQQSQLRPQNPLALQSLFNSLAHSIWVVDAQCYVHYANPIAQQTHQSARCLKLHDGHLQTIHQPDQLALTQALQKATQDSSQSSAVRSVLRLRVKDTKPPTDLLVLITPLQATQDDTWLNKCYSKYSNIINKYAGLAAIQLQKTSLVDPAMLCLLARSYKLTNTEELVLSLFCDGLDAPEVAATLNVAVCTIRTHVRALCCKMQVNSIRQLIVKVGLIPGAAGVTGMI